MITFDISQWRAWAPGLQTPADWQAWALGHQAPHSDGPAPDVSFLPAMQRRRLSRLARMAFAVGWPLAEGHETLPLVFVSRHGETPRTFSILSELAERQPLSPTQFSLSVHNAVIGLWSILRGETSEMTALAAAGDGFEHGVLEASALLAEGAPAVLLIVTEELPPEAYRPWIDDVPFAYALGLLLTPGTHWRLAQGQTPAPEATELPHALNWLRASLNGTGSFTHTWKRRTWNWQRQP
ncbi:beta-ketoacyl synthase chain length factor [Pseudomonas guariconensis]|uniref:beta-ketoacyl synthase chain length factor n=1 Tax=Pseudomonas TaxID=286 RepID=UPI001CE413EE|nr:MULTISPECIES: beta-ketoacyl synthase chain length factor [Pseudomonas]MCO7636007.1 beta-ketoacyl synthase chain length factor [Pseudomonas sp. S 311-6]MCO7513256.1 beta-ketoacyl synthase chain length factor [Pseudomonas putida]MCO7563351.1 beta-ketoacyl synthase chain length factor [Pseudomonas mosselii]MCO7594736.1 beta-ketoacyl synthase chain length factor [Pseudomonas guariconensis]MCO7603644.1 beta-ketoacyl synthase chain length factor [Pseudomonas guariconensis]